MKKTSTKQRNILKNQIEFLYTIIHKQATVGDALANLITNLDNKTHYSNSALILLRTSMLDIICIYFVLDPLENELEQQQRVSKILNDHIWSLYNGEDTEEKKEEIRSLFPDSFENSILKKSIQKIATKYMLKNITNNELSKASKNAFMFYQIFSKIEHNGLFTFNIMHKQYDPKEKRNKMMIYDATLLINKAILISILNWIETDNKKYIKLLQLHYNMVKSLSENN